MSKNMTSWIEIMDELLGLGYLAAKKATQYVWQLHFSNSLKTRLMYSVPLNAKIRSSSSFICQDKKALVKSFVFAYGFKTLFL